jgi:hypothetical protein
VKKIKFEMEQNMAALVVGSFANMIGSIISQYRNDKIEKVGGEAVLVLPYGGHITMREMPQAVIHKIQIMANLSTAFEVKEWMDMAYACQEKAITEGVIPSPREAPGADSGVKG